ncbi:MAG: LuxR C-terminal-related transcriptional regulator [Hyphomicrobiales bacterium]
MGTYATQDFLSKILGAQTSRDTWMAIEGHFTDLGFDVVNFGVVDTLTGLPRGFFTNMSDEWMRLYAERYGGVDPMVRYALESDDNLLYCSKTIDKLPGLDNPLAREMLNEAANFGLRCSYETPFRQNYPGQAVAFNLGSSLETDDFLPFFAEIEEDVVLATSLAQSFMPKLLFERRGMENWVPLNDDAQRLTVRELETLNWLANGLRVDRIAHKMNITNDTVNFHIKSIKQKLNAKTREHAIAIGFIENLIR